MARVKAKRLVNVLRRGARLEFENFSDAAHHNQPNIRARPCEASRRRISPNLSRERLSFPNPGKRLARACRPSRYPTSPRLINGPRADRWPCASPPTTSGHPCPAPSASMRLAPRRHARRRRLGSRHRRAEQLHKFDEEGAHQQKRKFNVHHASGSGRVMKEKAFSEDAPTAAPVLPPSRVPIPRRPVRGRGRPALRGARHPARPSPAVRRRFYRRPSRRTRSRRRPQRTPCTLGGATKVNLKIVLKPPDNTNKHMRGLHVVSSSLAAYRPIGVRTARRTEARRKPPTPRSRGDGSGRDRRRARAEGRERICAASSSRRSS